MYTIDQNWAYYRFTDVAAYFNIDVIVCEGPFFAGVRPIFSFWRRISAFSLALFQLPYNDGVFSHLHLFYVAVWGLHCVDLVSSSPGIQLVRIVFPAYEVIIFTPAIIGIHFFWVSLTFVMSIFASSAKIRQSVFVDFALVCFGRDQVGLLELRSLIFIQRGKFGQLFPP